MYRNILLFLFFPITIFAQAQGDTLEIGKNQIVFFSISQTEYDSLAKYEDAHELDEFIADFNYYSSQSVESYKDSLTIDAKFSDAHFFHIITDNEDTLIVRNELSQIVGVIANNGEQFILQEGVFAGYDFEDFMN
ncbi:MAG: hypothetical protein COZ80_10970 [Ignavibacteria bacterium CG_4_8_14_3_um_filter_37_9]|nr:hypothetical protein [Ignavibacteria bacterium]NCS82613.1 hypothetical protein [Ignavibacteria bacterium]OIO18542.1 MAG: hypothetical protein AUJ54_07775 [Ignavibacteria bacterium CG1_02_37_35]PIS46393.1 MAG: hypothetical protein COT22_00240 [Ignavibacteria bacterium CG08_land_8_20_14_0_20_37_9]PIW98374.1 MAG: hypothetical protein COZ80_10970 [Ignavibacteria bacterium CG_4_8_14_3_um_filter_37_9]